MSYLPYHVSLFAITARKLQVKSIKRPILTLKDSTLIFYYFPWFWFSISRSTLPASLLYICWKSLQIFYRKEQGESNNSLESYIPPKIAYRLAPRKWAHQNYALLKARRPVFLLLDLVWNSKSTVTIAFIIEQTLLDSAMSADTFRISSRSRFALKHKHGFILIQSLWLESDCYHFSIPVFSSEKGHSIVMLYHHLMYAPLKHWTSCLCKDYCFPSCIRYFTW